VFTKLPALRQRELYPGLIAEQEKLPIDEKRKRRKPVKGEPESIEAMG